MSYTLFRIGASLPLALITICPLSAQFQAAATVRYTAEKIASYSGSLSPNALSNRGWVAGSLSGPTLVRKPIRYRPGVGWEEITGSFYEGELFDINDAGTAVGYVRLAGEFGQAVIRPAGGALKRIGPSGKFSSAAAINEAGQVVGTVQNAAGEDRAFLYTEAEGMKILFDQRANAQGINENGEVTGTLYTSTGERHVFRWKSGDGMTDVNTWLGLTTEFRTPFGIADNGTIGGVYRAGNIHTLGTFTFANGLRRFGGDLYFLQANAINDRGWIVGSYSPTPDEEDQTASLYVYGEGIRDLNTLLVTPLPEPLVFAKDINDRDEILAGGGSGWYILRRVP